MKLYRYLLIAPLAAMAWACSEDDPFPKPTIDFSNVPVEVGVEVMFDNLTTNADHYEWRFGNTGKTSTDISPNVTFDTPGSVEVVLKAFTKDNQVDSVVKTITVFQRYLTSYFVKSFPRDSLGYAWDKNEALDEDKLPDVLVQFIVDKDNPSDDEYSNSILGPVFLNAGLLDVGNTVDSDLILTNESWVFILRDWDGLDSNNISFQNDPFSVIAGASFNPVQALSTKNKAGTEGSFSITGLDNNDNLIDIEFRFELR